jgi:hypothetical protein
VWCDVVWGWGWGGVGGWWGGRVGGAGGEGSVGEVARRGKCGRVVGEGVGLMGRIEGVPGLGRNRGLCEVVRQWVWGCGRWGGGGRWRA